MADKKVAGGEAAENSRYGAGPPSANEAGQEDGREEHEKGKAHELASQDESREQRQGNGCKSEDVARRAIFTQCRGTFVERPGAVDQHSGLEGRNVSSSGTVMPDGLCAKNFPVTRRFP